MHEPFYQLTALTLTKEGSDYMDKHPNAEWACEELPDPKTLAIKYDRLVEERAERNELIKQGKSLGRTRRERIPRGITSKEEYIEYFKNYHILVFKYYINTVRGFYPYKEDFGNALKLAIKNGVGHHWYHEGFYYTRFIISQKGFGIDYVPEDIDQLYYKVNKDGVIEPCEPFKGFENIIF